MILYDEPSDAYHAHAAIGSGDVRAFLRSPQLFLDQRAGLAPRETPAMTFGTACHMAILEPGRFARHCAVKPDGMSFATKEGKAWRASLGRLHVVTAEEAARIQRMHDRMPAEVREILTGDGRAEVTVRTRLHNLTAQCRADWWHAGTVYDLKTIAAAEMIDRAIIRCGYHIQQEWYQRVIEAETGTRPAFRFLFAESAPPHRWRIVELDDEWQEAGRKAVDGALHGIGARMQSQCWEDPDSIHILATPPPWLAPGLTETEEGIDL